MKGRGHATCLPAHGAKTQGPPYLTAGLFQVELLVGILAGTGF